MKDFKKLIAVRFLFNFAVRMQAVIVGWEMYSLTKDPLHLGLIGLAEAVPALSLAIFAGYLVDRSRPLLVYTNVLLGSLLSALIVFGSQWPGWMSVHEQIVALYVASFVTGMARGFSQPAMYAIVPRLLPRDHLAKAMAWLSSALEVAAVLGPALGGLVYGWVGVLSASALPCVSLILAVGTILCIKARIQPGELEGQKDLKTELLSGARFVFAHPILLPALALDMISVLFGGVTALLPIFASEVLHVGAGGLGLLRAAPAVGSAVMSFALTKMDIRAKAGPWLLYAVMGFGISVLVFGLSHSFALSMFVLGMSGVFDSISVVVRSTAVQLASPDDMRGRISAVNSIFIGSSNELGEFESGIVARVFGTVPAVLLGGVVCLLTVAGIAIFSPTLRKLDLNTLEQA